MVAKAADDEEYRIAVPQLRQDELDAVSVQLGAVLNFDITARTQATEEGEKDV
jgi:hypothetical protein